MPPGDDDEVVIRGEFEGALAEELENVAREARATARSLDETGAGGAAAAAGMDRASIAAGRLKRELEGVDRAAEQHRLAQLRLTAAEQDAQKIRQKGVLTAQETARVETMLSTAHRDAKKATDDLTAAKKELGRANDNLAIRLLRTAGSVGFLTKAFTGLKFVATADIFTSLAGGVSSLGAAGVAAVAGLAPLLGLVGGLPALGLAALSAFGMISFLTQGIGKAATALSTFGAGSQQAQAALRGLGPSSQAAAYDVANLMFSLKGLREEAMSRGLPYLQASLQNVQTLLPHVRTGMFGLVDAVGQVAQQGTQRIAGWGSDIDTILARNAQLVKTLGGSAIDALDVVRHIMIGAGPMVQDLAEHFASEMSHIDAELAANPQRIENYFNRVEQRTMATLHVLSDLGHGILSIFQGAVPLTDHMGAGIEAGAAHFREWAASAQGQNSIHKFFTDAIPVVDSMMHLLGQIGHSLASLSHNSDTAGMINSISAILPPLTKFLELIQKIANTVPGGNSVLAYMFLLNRMGMGPGAMGKGVFGAGRGAFRFGQGMRGVEGANESFAGRMGSRLGGRLGMLGGDAGAISLGGEAAVGGAGAAEGAAGLAPMLLNPIGLVLVAAAALGVLVAVLYRKWKPFHDAVDWTGRHLMDAFRWVEHHLSLIGKIAAAVFFPLPMAIYEVVKHFGTIERTVKNIGSDIGGWVKHLPGAGIVSKGLGLIGLYTGGPVAAGQSYLVGERGPELLAAPSGLRVLGGDGAELLHATEPGFVLPNEALRAITDPKVRDQAARALPVAAPVGAGGEWHVSPSDPAEMHYRPGGLPPDLPPIVVGPNYIRDEIDLERAVAAGIQRWERERKDRR